MKRNSLSSFTIIITTANILLTTVSYLYSEPMTAGFSIVDITPDIGMEIPGGFNKNISSGIHDPLEINTIVLKCKDQIFVLSSFDLLVIPNDVVAEIKNKVAEKTSLSKSNIILSATHTHSGGPIVDVFMSERNPQYVQKVINSAVNSILKALDMLTPINLSVDSHDVENLAYNRRFYMKNGIVLTHPGKMNPDIIAPAGPVDPQLITIYLTDHTDTPKSAIVNYALHATVLGGKEFSADYIYYLRNFLRQKWGNDFTLVFLNGACGDVTQVNNLSPPEQQEFGEIWAKKIGETLACEVYKGFLWRKTIENPILKGSSAILQIPFRQPNSVSSLPSKGLSSGQDKIYQREIELLKKIIAENPTMEIEISALRIGNIAIITNPTEMFCRLGLDIKKSSPALYTIVAELTNGYSGYCPTPEAFAEGGYEIQLARSSCMEETSAIKIISLSRKLLAELFSEKTPSQSK